MKLKDWAKKEGISYQTAYRWFKSGSLPVKAYQSESGTIIVQDEEGLSSENNMNRLSGSPDAMSVFLKKTVEFSKANCSIEDFAAYVIANFQLKINPSAPDMSLKYSKNKPSQNEVNKHFQQFIKPKHFNKEALLSSLPANTENLKEEVKNNFELKDLIDKEYTEPVGDSIKNFVEEATSSVLPKITPTSTNLVSSTNLSGATAGSYYMGTDISSAYPASLMSNVQINSVVPSFDNAWVGETQSGIASFQPTPRELQSFRNFTETQEVSETNELSKQLVKKAKRGRPKKST